MCQQWDNFFAGTAGDGDEFVSCGALEFLAPFSLSHKHRSKYFGSKFGEKYAKIAVHSCNTVLSGKNSVTTN